MGRRPASPDGPRTHDVRLPLTPGELVEIRAAAGEMPVAAWARGILLRQARRQAVGDHDEVDLAPVEDPAVVERRQTERLLDRELARDPRPTDPEIAETLSLTVDTVRRHREARGIEGRAKRPPRWEAPIREAYARGLSVAEIAEVTHYTRRTVEQRMSQLGLRAHRLPRTR